jgi:hypothetical protein
MLRLSLLALASLSGIAAAAPFETPSVSVARENGALIVRDAAGRVVHKAAGADGPALRWALAAVRYGGAVHLAAGRYVLDKTVFIDSSVSLTGDGRQTVLVPPPGDYAITIRRTDEGRSRRAEQHGMVSDDTLIGVVISMLAIDGEKKGKGIFLSNLAECVLEKLWIFKTRGAGLYFNEQVMETSTTDVHLEDCGDPDLKEAAVVIASQPKGDANNNLRFEKMYVIFPEYHGMEIGAGPHPVQPRLIFIHHSMFHGWLPVPTVRPYDLIRVSKLDIQRGLSITDSRLTNSGYEAAYLNVMTGDVKARGNVFGGGGGKHYILAEAGTRLTVTENTFQRLPIPANRPGKPTPEHILLESRGAHVVFNQNIIDAACGPVWLVPGVNSVISQNRFYTAGRGPRIRIGSGVQEASRNVIVSENFFAEGPERVAIEVAEPSRSATTLRDNRFGK